MTADRTDLLILELIAGMARRHPMMPRYLLAVLFAFSLAIGSTEASATLLYSGGEDIDFVCNGSCSVSTNANSFRAGWARESYQASGSASDPPSSRFATSVFAANSTLWIHAQLCLGNGCGSNGTTSNYQMIRVFDSAGNPTLVVRGTGTTGQVKISSRTSAGVFTDLATCSSVINVTLAQLDLFINYGTSGEVTLYSNSAQACDFSGNVTNGDGATTLNQVEFAGPTLGTSANWSEVIVATTDTRAMGRFTANTTANGNATGFSGTNVCSSIWNATTANDANFGFTGSNSIVHECTTNGSIPAGSYNVLGLVMSARVLVGVTGPQHFDFVTRTGGTDYLSSDFAPTTSFTNITNYIQTVNPATSSAWVPSDFQTTGFNVGEESKP
jgi:hypothetical protein